MSVYNKSEIIVALDKNITEFNNYILSLDKDQFEISPEGKWSAGQNLEHLIRAIKPLQPAFGLPKFILKIFFGKANRPSKSYEDLVAKYKSKLAGGGKASGPYIPPLVHFKNKEALVKKYELQKQKLIRKTEKQKENELDKYILPHPLLGKITLREMLFFTIYHNEHHLEILKQREIPKKEHRFS